MTPERWASIEDLFHRVSECESEKRAQLLEEASKTNSGDVSEM